VKHPREIVALAALGIGVSVVGAWADPGARGEPAVPSQAQRSYEDYVADLSSTDPDVRVRALRTLAASGYPEALAAMALLLGDPVDGIQLETINHVLDFYATARPSGTKRVALVVEVRSKGGSAQRLFDEGPFVILPRRTPPELPTGLSVAMRDQNPQVRVEATYTLGIVARPPLDPAVASVLQGGLRDPLREMRVAAARVLGALRVTQAGDALIEAVNDPEKDVKAAALRALGDIREQRAVQALTEQLAFYEKGPLAEAALDGLARIAHPSTAPLFASLLTSRDALVRRRDAEGLARCGDRQAASAVESALASERQPEGQLARAFAMEAAGQGGLDLLIAGLTSDASESQVMSYLVELGQPIAGRLTGYLGSRDPRIRGRVAMALGLIGGEEALAALEPIRRDPDTDVARAAERAIARIRLGQR
jgi:HEAT repeat protein